MSNHAPFSPYITTNLTLAISHHLLKSNVLFTAITAVLLLPYAFLVSYAEIKSTSNNISMHQTIAKMVKKNVEKFPAGTVKGHRVNCTEICV